MPGVRIPAPGGDTWTAFDYDRITGRWSDRDPVTGNGSGGTGRGTAVILTGNGRARWVLETWTDWAGERNGYEAIDGRSAREWLERSGFGEAAAEHFAGPSLAGALDDCTAYGEAAGRRDETARAAKAAGAEISEIARLMGISRATVYSILGSQS